MTVVAITGAAGTLGRHLIPMLLARGDRVRAIDVAPLDELDGVESRQVDIRVRDAVQGALEGTEALVHAAAWHGIHMRDHPPRDFWDLNATGTFNVYEAAREAGIERAVLASTMGVYGESRRPGPGGHAVRVDESLPLLPGDVYGATKVLAEELAAYYDRAHGVRGIALRFGMFVPEPFAHAGIRFLYGGVHPDDVALAVIAALDALADRPPGIFTAYNVMSAVPYDGEDAATLPRDPMVAVRRHWPDAPRLLAEADAAPWGPVSEWYPIAKAARELSWRPLCGFDTFLDELRAGESTT